MHYVRGFSNLIFLLVLISVFLSHVVYADQAMNTTDPGALSGLVNETFNQSENSTVNNTFVLLTPEPTVTEPIQSVELPVDVTTGPVYIETPTLTPATNEPTHDRTVIDTVKLEESLLPAIPETTTPIPPETLTITTSTPRDKAVYAVQTLNAQVNSVTYLDETNVLGSPGYEHWDILIPGTYVLTYSPAVINTNNNYAIRIFTSNVILDGNGKTITGPSIGSVESGPSYYGVRVNSGTLTQNVTVKNLSVSNKYFGIIYEYVQGGAILSSHVSLNNGGIYAWKCLNLNISSNTANSNTDGIVIDAMNAKNDYLTIDSNNIFGNSQFGIMLWQSNNHNIISNNLVNYNNNGGIVLTDGGTGAGGTNNTVSNNTVVGNSNGIYISHYNSNRIIGNSLSDNSNVALNIEGSYGNQFTGNFVRNSGWLGTYLTQSSNGNIFYNNVFKNLDNEYSDGSVYNNRWNTTPVAGTNIVGGPSIGGNYWSNPSSTGFSETCLDSNSDGFCDQSYNPQGDLIDYYPLHISTIDAQVTINTIPTSMVAGQSYPVTVTMKNTGTITWSETSLIRLGGVGDTGGDASKFGDTRFSIPSGTSVVPGQQYPFTFTMTAPASAGTYTPTYRMVWDGHQWFGAQTSTTVQVTAPTTVDADVVSHTIPGTMTAGQSYLVTVTMRNTGAMTWSEAVLIRLGGVGDTGGDAWTFGGARYSIASGTLVAAGEPYTFTFTMTAPATAGTYTPTYRMVWDGHEWFGAQASQSVRVK
jgi:parallel beta-helix repeat protein